jgi:3-hydroxybutyryl-CoA dehydrogenase
MAQRIGTGVGTADCAPRMTVVGAGLMGRGIGQVFARSGSQVRLYDRDQRVLEEVRQKIRSSLDLFVEMGLEEKEAADDILSRIKTCSTLEDAVADANFVVESAVEDLSVKQQLFERIDSITDDKVIISSNSSNFTISDIAGKVKRKARVITAHWFNPPYLIPVVELVRGRYTSEDTARTTVKILKAAGKETVWLKKEIAGFVVNRIQAAMLREILFLIDSGIAEPGDIDKAVSGSIGVRLAGAGPLRTYDLAGLDLILKGSGYTFPLLDNSTEPKGALKEKVRKGHHGLKTGRGFFSYPMGEREEEERKRDRRLVSILRAVESTTVAKDR